MVTTGDIRIRISKTQKELLRNMMEAAGCRNMSDYVRRKLFDEDLSLHYKMNKVIKMLEVKECKEENKHEKMNTKT